MRAMAVRVLVFDADGVTIFPWRFRDHLARVHGIAAETTAEFFRGRFLECLRGETDLLDVLPEFLPGWGWEGGAEAFVELWLRLENAPDARVLAEVQRLRASGLRCALASGQERRRADYIEHEMGFGELFDALFFSGRLGVAKPEPAFFERVARELGHAERPGELLLIDDSPACVAAARELGWRAELYTDFEAFRRQLSAQLG